MILISKYSPGLLPLSLPSPPISASDAVSRALSLVVPAQGEARASILNHLMCLSKIASPYPELARAFRDADLLRESAKIISTRKNKLGVTPEQFAEATKWILRLWNVMLSTDQNTKAQDMLLHALKDGFMDKFKFVAMRCVDEPSASLLYGDCSRIN